MELSQPISGSPLPFLRSEALITSFTVYIATRRSPKKADKKPVYVLNITVPPQQVDNCMEPAKATVQLQVHYRTG